MRAGLPVVVEEVTRGHLKSSCKVDSRDKFLSGITGKFIYLGA